jgi:hypothetical protein
MKNRIKDFLKVKKLSKIKIVNQVIPND